MRASLCFAIIGVLALAAGITQADDSAAQLSAGNTKFACDLYAHLKSEDGNLFFSPFSISSALAMTAAGARGDTAKQMLDVLGLTQLPDAGASYSDLIGKVTGSNRDGNSLIVANALWGQNGLAFNPDYVRKIKDQYSGDISAVDFAQPEAAAKTINDWVAKQTNDKIKDLLQPDTIKDSRLVLTNAIYFKGSWDVAFDAHRTSNETFNVSADQRIGVPTMHGGGSTSYFEDDSLQAVEMPYRGKELSMVILLPRKDIDLVEKQLTPEGLSAIEKGLHPDEVSISLPKFSMMLEQQLNSTLVSMGMTRAFDATDADFSGMTTQEKLMIGAVVHKAFVTVDEKGTQAAAATGVEIKPTAIRLKQTFIVDRSFVFVIRHIPTSSILFMGRVVNPVERGGK